MTSPFPECPLVVAYGLGVDSTAMLVARRGAALLAGAEVVLHRRPAGQNQPVHRLPGRGVGG
jgi:hypothetical protein